jgi:hypothetical protein
LAQDVCQRVPPPLLEYERGHLASCHVTAAEFGVAMVEREIDEKGMSYGHT